jgi:hypothetical protein
MPIILNKHANPQSVMLRKRHLRRIVLRRKTVWQKHRPKPPTGELSLETLEHKGVKLKAVNQDGNVQSVNRFH